MYVVTNWFNFVILEDFLFVPSPSGGFIYAFIPLYSLLLVGARRNKTGGVKVKTQYYGNNNYEIKCKNNLVSRKHCYYYYRTMCIAEYNTAHADFLVSTNNKTIDIN